MIQSANQILNSNQQFLETCRKVAAIHGVAALTNELGVDEAAEMQSLYTAIKDLVEAAAPNLSVPAIE